MKYEDTEMKVDISEVGLLIDPTSLLEQELGIDEEAVKQEEEEISIKEEVYESVDILS